MVTEIGHWRSPFNSEAYLEILRQEREKMRPITLLITFLSLAFLARSGANEDLRTDATVSAQTYPTRTVRIVEPFGLGGGPDLLARALAAPLSKLWDQPVTVNNITGAGATAGPSQVANSPADGYTLLVNTNAQAYSAVVAKNLPYDPLKDFVPVISLTRQPYVLVAGKSVGVTTVNQLISAAKARPGQLKFGSTGVGTGTHLAALKFNQTAGIKATHLPPLQTESNADMIANVIGGRIAYSVSPISLALPAINDGRLVALGVTTARRSTLLPNVPTLAESGLKKFDFPIWYGVWVRSGTPKDVIEKLARDIRVALHTAELREWVTHHGGELMDMTQSEFARFVMSESRNAARIIRAEGESR
jgi:tripartite-type tricarboxylate transporter receptor subunit TctC